MTDEALRRVLAEAGMLPASAPPRRDWTPELVVDAFVRYHAATGSWPTADDCNPSRLRTQGKVEALALWHALGMPYVGTVYKHLGTWKEARRRARLAMGR